MSVNTIEKFIPRNKSLVVAEIGVRYGESINWFIKRYNISKYYAIDPFVAYQEYEIDGFNKILKEKGGDNLYNKIKQNITSPNVQFIRKFSNEAHHLIPDKSLDICFIDGNHEYRYVMDDIKYYLPKIKSGGFICGDDYFMRHLDNDTKKTGGYPVKMVYEAVQDSFEKKDIIELGCHNGYPKTWLVKIE